MPLKINRWFFFPRLQFVRQIHWFPVVLHIARVSALCFLFCYTSIFFSFFFILPYNDQFSPGIHVNSVISLQGLFFFYSDTLRSSRICIYALFIFLSLFLSCVYFLFSRRSVEMCVCVCVFLQAHQITRNVLNLRDFYGICWHCRHRSVWISCSIQWWWNIFPNVVWFYWHRMTLQCFFFHL